MQIGSNGNINFFSQATGSDAPFLATTTPSQGNFADGYWHQLVFTWDRNDAGDNAARIYVDGQQLLSVTDDANSFSFSKALQIGRPTSIAGGLKRVFGGQLDEVALFNRALTPDEVSAQYLAAVPEPSTFIIWALLGLAFAVVSGRRSRRR